MKALLNQNSASSQNTNNKKALKVKKAVAGIIKVEKKNIEVKIHYPKGLNQQPAFKKFNKKRNYGKFKISDNQARTLLTIPVHQFINRKQQDYLIKNLKKFYKI